MSPVSCLSSCTHSFCCSSISVNSAILSVIQNRDARNTPGSNLSQKVWLNSLTAALVSLPSEPPLGGFPCGSDGKVSAYIVGDPDSSPGSGRSRNGNPLLYYCLENPMDRGAREATVHGVAKSRTRLRDFASLHFTSLSFFTISHICPYSQFPLSVP